MRNCCLLVLVLLVVISIGSCDRSSIEPNSAIALSVSTLAGSGEDTFANGNGSAAKFSSPQGIASDAEGNLYVADYGNNRIRKITQDGSVSTFAGSGIAGSDDGIGRAATFNRPYGIAVDGSGNVYVSDGDGSLIRKITPDRTVSTFIENTSAAGLATDATGNLYVADAEGNVVVKITPAGIIDTLAGNPAISGSDNGTGVNATFNHPLGVVVDASGNVYVSDYNNSLIRKITPSKEVTTIAGSGTSGFLDATGTSASFSYPSDLVMDTSGNLYVADKVNNRIRMITPAGVVTTLAGSGTSGFTNGIGRSATFNLPVGIAIIGSSGNLYVTEKGNHAIRKIIN